MTDKTITIIIPVYRAESTLKRCVDSVLGQTYTDWRLILVDDGSPDGSGVICDRYAGTDSRITVCHIPNGGAGNARNHGLDRCASKWVTFVDSDDSLEPEYLSNFHLAQHCDKSGIVIMQGYRRVRPDLTYLDEKVDLKTAEYVGGDFLEKAFSSDSIFEYGQVVGKVYDANLIRKENIRFTTDFQISEDHLFYLSYLRYASMIITYGGTLYNYIWDDGTIGLSRRKHPYYDLLIRYGELKRVCDDLQKLHPMSPSTIAKMDYFSITGSISLLLRSLYGQEQDRKKRIEVIALLMSDRNLITKSFLPQSLKGKLLKNALLYLPFTLSDAFMKIALKSI